MPPLLGTAYDTVDYVLNLARAAANDAALSISGNLLADDTPYTFVLLNSAYRDLQEKLTIRGYEDMASETILTQIQPVASPDPGLQVNITWTGYNNGTQNFPTPYLPDDMVMPIRLWERPTGALTDYVQMFPTNDGLPSTPQTSTFRWWEWRDQSIWMVGATQENDIRMRYWPKFEELTTGEQPVLIPRCANALAYMVTAKFAGPRGSPAWVQLMSVADQYISLMCSRTARKKQRGSHRRNGYGSAQGWGWGIFGY